MSNFLKAKNHKELEAELQELGRGIGPVRINEKGEIFVFDEHETKKEYKMGQIKMPTEQETSKAKTLHKAEKDRKRVKINNI